MDREEKTFLRAMGYVLATFVVMTWSLWALAPQTPPTSTPAPEKQSASDDAPATATESAQPSTAPAATFTAQATYPPLVEHGFEVLGPTSRRPGDPAPGQRYFDTDLNTYSIFTGASWQAVNVSAGIGNIDDIGDVSAVSPSVGEFLGWNGSAWSNLTLSLSTLTDAEITSATPGQSLRFNGSNFINANLGVDDLAEITIGAWEEGETLRYNGSGLVDSKLSLYDLSNLNVSSPANGQVLSYNSGTAKWVNSTLSVTTNLDGLSDVSITSAATGDFLGYNGTAWVDTPISLDSLSDVAITAAATGEVLRFNGTNFVDATLDFDDLANVTITSWATGEVPRWNGSALVDATLSIDDLSEVTVTSWASGETLRWNGSALVDSKLQLNDLTDVNLTSLTDNQFLRYDGGTSKIINETIDVPADARYFVVTEYGAVGDGVTDDTDEIGDCMDAAVAYASANDAPAVVFFPALTFIVQNPTTAVYSGASDGGVIIPDGADNIHILGYGATLKIGSNGINTSAVRCYGDNCSIRGLTLDPNRDAAPVNRDTDADYAAGTLTANGTTTITGSGTTWTKEMVGRTITIGANTYTITAFTSTTSLTLSGSPTGGAGLSYNIWPFKTKDNSGFELNGCENSVIVDCHTLSGDKPLTSYNTGQVSFDFTGGSSERLVTLTGGSWPGWVGVDAAITIQGVRYAVASAPTTTTLTLSANSSTSSINNPGLDVSSTSDWKVEAYSTASGGENDFLIVNGRRCRIERCLSVDCIYAPFFVSAPTSEVVDMVTVPIYESANYVTDCTAVNFRGNGLRINEARSVFIRGFTAFSERNDGRSGILCDAGSSVGNLRTDRIFIDNCELYCNPDGDFDGAASTLKLAAANQVHVSNCKIECGTATNNVAVRCEDNLRNVFLGDCYIRPVILFTPASGTGSIFQGNLTAAANNGSGYVRYTVSGTPSSVIELRELHVRGSAVQQYNGPQQVTDTGAGYIDTDRPFVSTGIGSAAYGQTQCESFKMRNCVVDGIMAADRGITTVSFYNYFIDRVNAFNVDIEGCTFRQFSPLDIKYGGVLTNYLNDNGMTLFRFVGNTVTFDSDKLCKVIRDDNEGNVEVQRVTITGTPTSGSYTLTHNGNTTGSIAYNASAATVQTALRLLPGLSAVTVSATGTTPNFVHTVTFRGVVGDTPQMTNTDGTSGGTHAIANSTTTAGVADPQFVTSRKVAVYRNTIGNKDSGTVLLNNKYEGDDSTATYDERDIIFACDGDRLNSYFSTTYPVDPTITWSIGDIVYNTAPTASSPLYWTCVVAGSPGTWQAIYGKAPILVHQNITEVACTDGTAQDLMSYAMPANTLSRDGDMIDIEASFEFATDADAKQVQVILGSTTLYDSTSTAHNGGGLVVHIRVVRESSTTAKCIITALASGSGTPITSKADVQAAIPDFGTSLTIKGRADATNVNDVSMESLIVQLVPAVPSS